VPTFDATTATCSVFAHKEGLLSAVGHDVRLAVKRFSVEVAPDRVVGTFDARSVSAVCATRQGQDAPGTLSAKDLATIDGYVQNDILETRRHAEIRFESAAVHLDHGEGEFEGTLTLHGRSREITVRVSTAGGRTVARVRLSQPDFGITPFKAMLGTLRIQPQVDVELSVPALGG
jgi:hypothetical protein